MANLFDIDDLSPESFDRVLDLALSADLEPVLLGKGVALLFEKPSARTRNATEMAVHGLGGHPVYIQGTEVGLDSRESAEDVARTLGCYHSIICARVFDHSILVRMAAALRSSGFAVPIINLLSNDAHPGQAIADILTLRDSFGALPGRSLAYLGDANNMARSLAKATMAHGMEFRIASPPGYCFSEAEISELEEYAHKMGRGGTIRATNDPKEAADGVDAFYTDVWTSMGQEHERDARLAAFAGFTLDDDLVGRGASDAIVLHCLPAHRGEEITHSLIEGKHSVVWRQAAHRRTAMRGILAWSLETAS